MKTNFVLEICVDSIASAVAAERAGTHRIELCSGLADGGITPSAGLMQRVRKHVRLPIHVIIRPRTGNFCYSRHEFEVMRDDILAAKQFGMEGVALGILNDRGGVDVKRTRMLVECAHPLPVTFHRAFDVSGNLEKSLEAVIRTGASRILTSGGRIHATNALPILARLVQAAGDRIVVMPGGGINAKNIVRVIRATRAREVHTSVGISHTNSTGNGNTIFRSMRADFSSSRLALFEQRIRRLKELLGNL